MSNQIDLANVKEKLSTETGLAEVITTRMNGRPLVSVVNVGVLPHPETGEDVVALVSRGPAVRLDHLRRNPEITVAIRRGWDWVAVDGVAELAGPQDPNPAVPSEQLSQLLRDIYMAAGGTHDDYDEYDRAMAEDERCAVLITPTRTYSNRR